VLGHLRKIQSPDPSRLHPAPTLGIPSWKLLAARFGSDGAQEIPPPNEPVLKAAQPPGLLPL
jgi:hypothetical protein